ncbi:transcription factor ASG4-like [Hibiscus syriacus]|uniref:Transcription factor ASG4-like n=1 Tax=Hibiscus syriacus TaxID=106335 RepID=A0A6A2YQK9_HIBSY|nr:transcription factor ASG4-like [Hibiscus syriacus]
MDHRQHDLSSILTQKPSDPYDLINRSSVWLEIRLFYFRIAPCVVDSVPDHLTLFHLRREIGVSLEINGSRVPASDSAVLTLSRVRLNREASEVTYLSTDSVRVTGGFEFEAYEDEKKVLLCGSLGRMEGEWSMDCYLAAVATEPGNSSFFQPKMGVSAPGIEVYIAGCCAGTPVILTKNILVSPKKKGVHRLKWTLDAIPEDEELGKGDDKGGNGLNRQRKLKVIDAEVENYDSDGKIGHSYYAEEMYAGEDGQLSWFNAGVRVGVGIGLGVCLGVGVGVGLLMRSYQATTRNIRRRFF